MENQLNLPEGRSMIEDTPKKRHFPKIRRRHVIITCAVLLIAAALVLNFVLFGGKQNTVDPAPTGGEPSADTGTTTPTDSTAGYFSATQVSRQRARDEALEVLQGVVDNENADEATKAGALQEIKELAAAMEAEANIESLVLAKGFSQCVAVINGDTCSVVVNGTELLPQQISQINEIVYEQAGILPANIRIITK